MARRSPQTLGKRERERAKMEKRERKQEKKAAAAAAKAGEGIDPAVDPETGEPILSETEDSVNAEDPSADEPNAA